MTVAMKPRTRISFWWVGGSFLLGLSAWVALNPQAAWSASFSPAGSSTANSVLKNWDRHLTTAVSPGVRAVPLGASPIFQRPAKAGCCRGVDGAIYRVSRAALLESTPLSRKTPAGSTSPQRAVLRIATDSPVAVASGPCCEAPVTAHLPTVNGRSIVFSLQKQHVRMQI
jgi:hypothetical protein